MPADRYALSPRRFDGVLRQPDYGPEHAVRRVRPNGEIKWRGHGVYVNQALAGEPVGLVEGADGGWTVFYGPVRLGIIDHRGDRLNKPKHRARKAADAPHASPPAPPAQQRQQG